MGLTDEQIQSLQNDLKKNLEKKKISEGERFSSEGQLYVVVHRVNDTTQALAVAPVYSDGQVDYSQTAIVVAGA
ncbi:hypothetical protein [Streptococcus pantholopis]|uniref:Uncharacterized protein n=1 Tax=Streptococcus pantholopis TaxID=1811193 RepID=A0A172Q968_9STRE|nr:hypothetical protein [Streptococcus pantholopis]AND79967.1 hypothetical protein A0O21_08115 [Streptococcus pantholopis]